MKILCDVCDKAQAIVICCADEAALCANCDVEIHAANKLASKHQRLHLECFSNKLPLCDICQEKSALIFCVEDRALFCQDCDESIHSANTLSRNHQRFLASGIRVALPSKCEKKQQEEKLKTPNVTCLPPPTTLVSMKMPSPQPVPYTSPSWAMDDFLHLSDFEIDDKKEVSGFGDLEWITQIGFYNHPETLRAGIVPEVSNFQASDSTFHRSINGSRTPNKKPRIQISEDEFFIVPDLG